ncbi:thiamine ABC transporter substrate-binding protein [bacterium]|nr:thiamine ABC transporter substrate-binding protein [bacterium]
MRRMAVAALALALLAGACGDNPPDSVRLITHESFAVSDDVLAAFTEETGITVEILATGDAGQIVNQAILTAGNPVGDVLFGVDTTFLSRALDADLFVPYRAGHLDQVAAGVATDPENRVTPMTVGDVCINYDKSAFTATPPPSNLADLTDPVYRGMLVVQNPATSSPGLAFLLATIARFGEGTAYPWQDFWADLRANDVSVAGGWEEAYYGSFTVGGGGDRPIVVSYASSPPAEVIFAETPPDEAPTAVMIDGCFRQVEYAGILRGSEREDAARALIEFMLSNRFQEDVPLTMFVFPVLTGAELPPEFVEHTVIPADPAGIDPALIEANRERWIEEWTSIVLR